MKDDDDRDDLSPSRDMFNALLVVILMGIAIYLTSKLFW